MSTPADKQSNQYNNVNCRDMIDEIPLLICRYTPDFNLTFVNKAYCEWLGKSPDELQSVNILNMIPEAQRDDAVATVRALTPENPRSISTHQAILENGTTRWIEWTDTLLLDDDNQTIGYQAIGRDVTQIQAKNRQLAGYRAIIEASNNATILVNQDHRFEVANRKYISLWFDTETDLIGKHISEVAGNDIYESTAKPLLDKCLGGEVVNFSQWMRFPNTDAVYVDVTAYPVQDDDGNTIAAAVTMQDRTAQKHMEDNIRFQGEMLENIDDSVYCIHVETGKFVYANAKCSEMFGWTSEELIGQPVSIINNPAANNPEATAKEIMTALFDEGRWDGQVHNIRKDGTPFWSHVTIKEHNHSEYGLVWLSVNRDIDAQKQAQQALAESEALFRSLIENSNDIITVIDADGVIRYESPSIETILGYTPDDMIGQKAIRFVNNISLTPDQQTFLSEEDVERFDFNALFANVGDFGPIKIGSRHQDGSMRTLDIRGINLLDDDNFQGVIIFASDITEQTIAEQRLLASEKRYRQMFEQIHLPELIINPDTHSIMDVNPRAIDFFGYTLSDLHQLVFEDLCTVLSPTFDLTYYFEHGYPFTLTQIDANGTTHEMEIYPGIIDWQGKPAWYAVEVDVTQRNNAQRAIQRANMRLEQRVQQRTEQLERVKNQIETIFNNSGDGILLLNSELVIQQANYYSDWLLGMAGEEYFGTNLRDAIHTQDIPTFETAIQTIINRKVSQNIEIRIRRTDRYIDTEMSVSPVLNPAQTVGEIVVIIRDVTERKAAEAQLRYLASLPDQMQDAVISTDMNRIVRSWNKAAERMYGYTQEEAIGKVVSTLVGTEYLHGATAKSSYDTLWEQGYWEDEIIQHHRDGTPINVLASAVVTYDENGQPIGMIGVNHDFTKRKQAEDQLRYLASLQAFMTDALITVNNDGIIMSWNAAAERMYGYTEDDVLGKPLRDVLKPIFSHNESIASVWEKAYEDGFWTGEAQHQSEDAPVMFTVVSVALIRDTNGEPTGLLHLHRDDTARRLSQIAIAESEARYRLLAENVTDMISRHTPEGVYTYATPSSVHITSYTPDELVGRLAYEFFNPDDIPAVQASHAAIRENTDITTTQYRFVRKDDTKNWVETTSHSIRDANGEIIEIVAVTRDITERKQALDELKDVHERLSLATSAANVGVWEFDVPTGELFWDDGMLDLFGANRASFTGTIDEWQKRVHPEDIAEANERFVKSIESGEDLITEFRIITSDNTIRYLRAIAKNIPDETGKTVRVIGINLDITDHKQAERTLQAALESERELGELKSRIVSATSHEFRTPLASILATVETLTKYRDRLTEEKIDLRLAKIANQVQHMKDITGDMLQYTRMQSGIIEAKPEAGDLHTLCLDVVHNFNQQTEYLDRVRYQSNVDSLPYRYDPKLIRQVLNNLVHNALKYSSEDSLVHLSLEKSETQINITIRDDGIGIPSKDLHRLFDPFHRASNVGTIAGTGLGLSIVKQAIEAHNGTVQVESQLQHGSTFTITLPLQQGHTHD